MSATWKGYEKPGGAKFYVKPSLRNLPDCPACKYGTLQGLYNESGTLRGYYCIDCKAEFKPDRKTKL